MHRRYGRRHRPLLPYAGDRRLASHLAPRVGWMLPSRSTPLACLARASSLVVVAIAIPFTPLPSRHSHPRQPCTIAPNRPANRYVAAHPFEVPAQGARYQPASQSRCPCSSCAAQVHLQCAWCHWQLGDLLSAETTYGQVLDDDPLCWQALLDRARMHLGQAKWEAALPDLDLVAGLGGASAETLNDRGVCYYELDDMEAALKSFNEAIDVKPTYAQSYTNRGNCYRRLAVHDATKLERAHEDYTRAVELDPTNPKSYNNRGALLLKMGKLTSAFEDFEHALEIQPEYEVARRNLEVAREQKAKEEEGAAQRAQMYVRRLTVGDQGMYNEPGSAGLACAGEADRDALAALADAEQQAGAGGAGGRRSLQTYTDGGSAAAMALQVGVVSTRRASIDHDAPHEYESTSL